MANWKEPKNDYKKEDQVVPEIFNTLAENERYLQEKKITTEQVQDAVVNSTPATSRDTIGGSETVKGFFGKVRKWLADLKALAFKKTVATADIDDSAVTDAKIKSVSASKVTGLHKVATSGDYNDLINKPSTGGGGGAFNFQKHVFYAGDKPDGIDDGIYLAFAIFLNAGSYANTVSFGAIALNKELDNGAYSNISSVIFDAQEMKVQLHAYYYNGKFYFSVLQSDDEQSCPYKGFEADGSFQIYLYKLSDLGTVAEEGEHWESLDVEWLTGGIPEFGTSLEIKVDGLKKGDTIRLTAGCVKVNMAYDSDSYFYNTSNVCYGWAYWGPNFGEEWHQLETEDEVNYQGYINLTTDSPWKTKVGLLDYTHMNEMTIKISCKRNGYLNIEWSDKARCFIQNISLFTLEVLR